MERDYYPLAIAAEMLNCSTDDLIYLGVKEKIEIGIVVGNGILLKQVIDSNGKCVEEKIASLSSHTIKLDTYCLRDYEADLEHAEVILCIHFKGRADGNSEVLKMIDQNTDKSPLLIKDCKLIVYAEDVKRLQLPKSEEKERPTNIRTKAEEKKLRKIKDKEFVINEVIPHLKSVHPSLKMTTDIGKYFKNKDSYNKANELEQRFHDICVSGGKNAIYVTVYKWLLDSDNAYFIKGSEGHSSNI